MNRLSPRRAGPWAAFLVFSSLGPLAGATTFTGFGDSITFGIASSWGEGYITIYRYYNSWEMPAVAFENQGLPDETTTQGLARISSAISGTGATHIFIMEGTNDVNGGVSADTIVANLEAMAGIAVSSSVIPVMGCVPPRRSTDGRDPGNDKAREISQRIGSFAAANGYPFGAIFDAFMAQPNPDALLSDRVHPNDYGYIVMARAWHDGVRPIYGPPTLASCTPNWAPSAASTPITLTGTAFGAGMRGYLFSMFASPQVRDIGLASVASSTQATLTVPAGLPLGFYDVVLAYPTGGGAILYDGFSSSQPPPTFTLSPDKVPSGQVQTISLSGSNLQNYAEVYFGASLAGNFAWYSSSFVQVSNPLLPPGAYDVTYVCPDRAQSTVASAFYSLGTPPDVQTVTPNRGDNDVAVPITVGGTAFMTGAQLFLGATALTPVIVVSAVEIRATVPAGFPDGVYDVTVRNPDSQTDTLPGGYTSEAPPPIVTSVNPSTVEASDRTALTIAGQNFKPGSRVTAGTTDLVEIVVVSDLQIDAVTPQTLAPGVYDVTVTTPAGKSGTLTAGLTVVDTRAPDLVSSYPEDTQVGAPLKPYIELWLHDAGSGIDTATIQLDVNGTPETVFTTSLGPELLHLFFLPAPFAPSQGVSVRVRLSDLASPPQSLDRTITFTVSDAADGDGDGLASDWETSHGLDPASSSGASGAAGDPDRDTAANSAEQASGSDPTTKALLFVAPGPGSSNASRAALFLPEGRRFDAWLTLPYNGYGLHVGLADLLADGSQELLTGPGPSPVYGPQVRGFGADLAAVPKCNFFAYSTLRYGVKPSSGSVEGGYRQLILTGPGPGPVFGPQVRGFRYTGSVSAVAKINFYAYQTLKYGVTPGSAELDGDGFAEILTGAAAAPVFGPHVRGFNYDASTVTAMGKVSFFAFNTLKYGVNPTSGDVDRDGFDEILTGPGPSSAFASQVRGFNVDGGSVAAIPGLSFLAFPATIRYGAKVASGDLDGDRADDIAVAHGEGAALPARVRTFFWNGSTITAGVDFYAWDGTAYGANVVAGMPGISP